MARIRLNQEYRTKIANRMRVHLEQENTQEKEKYLQAREEMKPLQDITWTLAEQIVRRHYTPEDVKMARHLQNKFENVDTIAKDSCFHFGYMGEQESRDQNDKPIMEENILKVILILNLTEILMARKIQDQMILLMPCIVMNSKVVRIVIPILISSKKIINQIHIGQRLMMPIPSILD